MSAEFLNEFPPVLLCSQRAKSFQARPQLYLQRPPEENRLLAPTSGAAPANKKAAGESEEDEIRTLEAASGEEGAKGRRPRGASWSRVKTVVLRRGRRGEEEEEEEDKAGGGGGALSRMLSR